MSREAEHIGDGVYARFDGYMVELSTERSGRIERIYLEPQVYEALRRYVRERAGDLFGESS